MSERFTIVVTPPDGDNGSLSVQDAMQQVLDAFQLLMSSSKYDEAVEWKLVEAKTNSPPFSVVGEARSTRLGIEIDLIAKRQKEFFSHNYNKLLSGAIPESWSSSHLIKTAEDLISRNCNGIFKTEIIIDTDNAIALTREKAISARNIFDHERPATPKQTKPYKQMGSVEGIILEVKSYYNNPAIKFKERKSGEVIWCLIEEEHRQQIVEKADFEDVWSSRRVRVHGKLEYASGRLCKVHVSEILSINPQKVILDEIKDTEFTSGLSVSEYIDRLREGQID